MVDRRILESGDPAAVRDRTQAIFDNRNVGLGFYGTGADARENPAQRLRRIANEVMHEGRSFDDVRSSVDRLSTMPSSQPKDEAAPELPGLSPEDFADLAARRRQASSQLEDALARREAEQGRAESRHAASVQGLGRDFDQRQGQVMGQTAAAGTARSPRMAGRQVRGLRDQQQQQRSQLDLSHSERLQGLQEMANTARAQHDSTLANLDAEETRRRSNFSRLAPGLAQQ